MQSSICSLCGVAISDAFPEQWLKEFRVLYAIPPSWHDVKLSGVGSAPRAPQFGPDEPGSRNLFVVMCPMEASMRYDDEDLNPHSMVQVKLGLDALDPQQLAPTPITCCGFGFHAKCWDLLVKIFHPNLSILFSICLSMPIFNNATIQWGHDYGGAASVRVYPTCIGSSPEDLASHIKSSVFRSDPMNIPDLHQISQCAVCFEPASHPWPPEKDKGNLFHRLPVEILHNLVTTLDSSDIANLRLACRLFAGMELPELFWESRFQTGYEFSHLFEFSLQRPKSWKASYMFLRILSRQSPAIQNRARIWDLGLKIQAIHDQVVETPCEGLPLASKFEPDGNTDDGNWHMASHGLIENTSAHWYRLQTGCRGLRARSIYFSALVKLQRLIVSLVYIDGDIFISGLQFLTCKGETKYLGYITSFQRTIALPPPGYVTGWHLALSENGITAIALETSDDAISPWVGEPEGYPKWRLSTPQKGHLKAEFDAMRLLSFGFEDRADSPGKDRCFWSSSIPPPEILCDPSHSERQMRSWGWLNRPRFKAAIIDPATLIGVTAYIYEINAIAGIEFRHSDSTRDCLLGQRMPFYDTPSSPDPMSGVFGKDHAAEFEINGPGGERITEIRIEENPQDMLEFEVSTNFGRRKSLLTPKYDPEKPWKLKCKRKSIILQPSGAQVIGMFAACGHLVLNYIGLLSRNVDVDKCASAGDAIE